MRKIIFTPKAIRKISQIDSFISSEFGLEKAKNYKRTLKNRIKSLKSYPFQGESIHDLHGYDTKLRRLYVPPNNVIYQVEDDNILIYDIFHDKEDYITKLFF